MEQKLKTAAASQLTQQLRNWFDALSNREQRLVTLLASVVALTVIWLVGLAPAIEALTVTRPALAEKQAQASRVLALADTVAALRERGGRRGQASDAPELQLQSRIELMQWQDRASVEDRGDGVYAVDINGVPAVDALDWLDNTERLTGLALQNLTLEKISTGTVSIRSLWKRPAGSGA
jgi:type II secretory pathway component PulM